MACAVQVAFCLARGRARRRHKARSLLRKYTRGCEQEIAATCRSAASAVRRRSSLYASIPVYITVYILLTDSRAQSEFRLTCSFAWK